jgi:CheY-like chemotaxis protein
MADAKLVELLFDGLQISHRLTVVVDGAEALRRLFDPVIPKPNLVLLDLNLPTLSGLEVLRKLREDPATVSVTVAVLTGSTAEVDVGARPHWEFAPICPSQRAFFSTRTCVIA